MPIAAKVFDAKCTRCPRLARHLGRLKQQYPDYHCAPVSAWGHARSRLLIVGLAPGTHGANRTGIPFTGDASGETLMTALVANRFASLRARRVRLSGCRITNAVRCVPPENRPAASEMNTCRGFLAHDIELLWNAKVRRRRCIVALGGLAFESVRRCFEQTRFEGRGKFAHGATFDLAPNLRLLATYHPSRLNTNTGRLTEAMLIEIFRQAQTYLAD